MDFEKYIPFLHCISSFEGTSYKNLSDAATIFFISSCVTRVFCRCSQLSFCLDANKIALKVAKIEIILCLKKTKNMMQLRVKLCRKGIMWGRDLKGCIPWAIPEKKQIGGLKIYFSEAPLEFINLSLYP